VTGEREEHQKHLDWALRDMIELSRQVQAGEVSDVDERWLRKGYEREIAAALGSLDRLEADAIAAEASPAPKAKTRGRRGLVSRLALYATALLVVIVAVLLLPGNILDRPQGGFVTGNEALQDVDAVPAPAPTGRDLSAVSNAEMEAVVDANPDVIGMRLALADRYTESGRYDLAAAHYRKALEQDPSNPQGTASVGWLMFQLGEIDQAAELVDRALQMAPELVDGWWYKANIRLYGFDDPAGAIDALDVLRARPELNAEVRDQVESLRQEASKEVAR
tara:strand:+ start:5901 stop:6734 length:834 start_codon:yes stop_codon:yes gene_type:complete